MTPTSRGVTAARCWIAAILSAAACTSVHAEPRSGPWEAILGGDHVTAFTTDFLPPAESYFAYAADGRPGQVFVATGDRTRSYPPQVQWTPPGKATAAYVFVLNTISSTVSLMHFEDFLTLETVSETFRTPLPDEYPKMDTGGEVGDQSGLVSIREGPDRSVAAVSFDTVSRKRTTFGLPSLIPFLGRKHFIERKAFQDGYIYFDVFRGQEPRTPRVRLRKRIDGLETRPDFSALATWVEGSEVPRLILVDKQRGRPDQQDRLLLIEP